MRQFSVAYLLFVALFPTGAQQHVAPHGAAAEAAQPPTIRLESPQEGAFVGGMAVEVRGRVVGTAPIGVKLTRRGERVLPGQGQVVAPNAPADAATIAEVVDGRFVGVLRLVPGANVIEAHATNAVGSEVVRIRVTYDPVPPTIEATVTPPANAAGWHDGDVVVSFEGDDDVGLASLSEPVTVTSEGAGQMVTGTAVDLAGNVAHATVTLNIDNTAPQIVPDVSADGVTVTVADYELSGEVLDAGVLDGLTCDGVAATIDGSRFSCSLSLVLGLNDVAIEAADLAGNVGSLLLPITFTPFVAVAIDEPIDGLLTNLQAIDVSGSVSEGADVTVNGVVAELSAGTFLARDVPLGEGRNTLTAIATAGADGVGVASVQIVRDTMAPSLSIEAPATGSVVATETLTIVGTVNDVIVGTINQEDCEVVVSGPGGTRFAEIVNRSFLVAGFPLVDGTNVLSVVATDGAGNSSAPVELTVNRQEVLGLRLEIVGGDMQNGVVGELLDQQLMVRVVDDFGNPVAGRGVSFEVSRGDGTLVGATGPKRRIAAQSDANGLVGALYRLGTRTGVGNQRVRVTGAGISLGVEFCARALPAPPDKIVANAGENQRGIAGMPLPLPLLVVLLDVNGNPLANVPVTYEVRRGAGSFDGEPSRELVTDDDGRAAAIFTLGPDAGVNNNVVDVRFEGMSGPPARFVASGRIPGDPAATRVSGVVLDNSEAPIPGATASIDGSSATAVTDADGRFTIFGAPVGAIHLVVDGGTSPRPEIFPKLEFELVTVSGTDNTVGMPILIPALDPASAQNCGGAETCVLQMANVPGLTLTIFPNSVTFADGSTEGLVSLTQVNLDKVPMPPPNGTVLTPAWTLQPAGTHFDPPAAISVPNTSGLAPGAQPEIYTFDHDLGEFIAVGPATVSEDGATIVSDPGYGIAAAGWGGAPPPPPPPSEPTFCGPCRTAVDGQCEPLPDGTSCDDGESCTFDDACDAGSCVGTAEPDGGVCDDGLACTFPDACSAGQCIGEPLPPDSPCTTGNPCTINQCDSMGQCVATEVLDDCCGNGDVEAGEECDDGDLNSDTVPNRCRTDCQRPFCGDGVQDSESILGPEECDDGEAANTGAPNACRPNCEAPRCGDITVDDQFGEQCDLGNDNSFTPNTCRPGCLLPSCGDGVLDDDQGEDCDDGNVAAGDGCSPGCLFEACGNGLLDTGELCDDGNTVDDATCSADCSRIPACGDGVLDVGETCDDGNAFDDATCSADCSRVPLCGDGIPDGFLGESCDDGNLLDGDGCSSSCQLESGGGSPFCGDGVLDPGELCDDGQANTGMPNACRPDCTLPACGDGVLDDGPGFDEECDDGNDVDDDLCPNDCSFGIELRPRLILGLALCDTVDRPIEVRTTQGVPITTEPDVTYEWIGNGIEQALIQPIIDELNAVSGATDLEIAQIDVAGDRVVFLTEGFNVLRARRGGPEGEVSNFSVVISGGMQLAQASSLKIGPFTSANLVADTLSNLLNEGIAAAGGEFEIDPPMILFPGGPTCTSTLSTLGGTGIVIVEELKFDFFGGQIKDVDLMQALGDLIDLIPAGSPLRWIGEAVGVFATVGVNEFIDFEVGSKNAPDGANEDAVIRVTNDFQPFAPPFISGVVTAKAPGLSSVQAELDLEEYCLGKASDSMLVVVAPELVAVDIRREEDGRVEEPLVTPQDPLQRQVHAVGFFNLLGQSQNAISIDPLGLIDDETKRELARSVIPGNFEGNLAVPINLPLGATVDPTTGFYEDGSSFFGMEFNLSLAADAIELDVTRLELQLRLPNPVTDWDTDDPTVAAMDPNFDTFSTIRGVSCAPTPPLTMTFANVEACIPFLTVQSPKTDSNAVLCNAVCGNGTLDLGESCEPPGAPQPPNQNGCRGDCTYCGDGIVDIVWEDCDDGNAIDDDACTNDCRIPNTCGDGVLETAEGESCEPPGDAQAPFDNLCRGDCTFCGDGIQDAGEQCEPAGTTFADGTICREDCTIQQCGDGVLDPGEQCEPAGTTLVTGEICRLDCTLASCGDGTLDSTEECDPPGSFVGGVLCRSDCTLSTCGDGVVDIGEACDDGNAIEDDGCRSDCTPSGCGDGVVDTGEACDDGNGIDDDACRNNCTIPTCGDGIVDSGEACDDGNADDFDGCAGDCTVENAPLVGELCISEVVTDPQSDWSGIGFSGTAPLAGGTPDDEYVEIRNSGDQTVSLLGVFLRMTDATPEIYAIGGLLGPAGVVEVYSPGSGPGVFPPGATLVIGNPPGTMDDEIFIELVQPGLPNLADVEIGGNTLARNFEADDDRDGSVNEDLPDGLNDDGDLFVDEDGVSGFPYNDDPIADGAPGAGLDGGATGPADEALHRVRDTGIDRLDFQRGAGTPARNATAIVAQGLPSDFVSIDEINTRPQRDWRDATGSGVPFDSQPGPGTIAPGAPDQEYVEIRNRSTFTVSLRDAVLEMVDGTPERYRIGSLAGGTIEHYSMGGSADGLLPGEVLVIGDPPGEMADEIFVRLTLPCIGLASSVRIDNRPAQQSLLADDDGDGAVNEDPPDGVDNDGDGRIDEDGANPELIGQGGGAPTGPVTGPNNEALRRVGRSGVDSQDFFRGNGNPGTATGPN